MRHLIIGASAAGMAAAEAIRRLDSKASITVLSQEPDMPYFRPMTPFIVSGKKDPSEIMLVGQGPYQGANIDVRLNSTVVAIHTADQRVILKGGEELHYDKLLIAAGSKPHIPNITGIFAEGVFALRTLSDARAMASRAERTKHAVMLGGGLLSLKTAFALLERGLEVTLIIQSPEVLSQLMEPNDATLIRNALIRAGLRVMTGCSARQILSDANGVNGILLDDGREVVCQMVCIGKGVRPNVDFLGESSIRVDQGVVVDRFTACSAPHVFAAGDVAVTLNPATGERIITGLWTNAVEMGRCAGRNMAGQPTEYTGALSILNATQVADVPFVSMGVVHASGTDYEVHIAVSSTAYRKFVFTPDGKNLIGALFVGDISRAGLYRNLIREGRTVRGIKSALIKKRLNYGHILKETI
jgi:NAD(P)H-nitrite reductase large subunit